MLLFLGLETLRIFYGETDPVIRLVSGHTTEVTAPCSVRFFRLEGEPVRALSGLLRVAPHPVSLRGAGRLRPAAADLRPAARVHPQRRPALLLRPRVPARTLLLIGLLQVA